VSAIAYSAATEFNARPLRKLQAFRRQLLEAIERPGLRPFPARRYELASWKRPGSTSTATSSSSGRAPARCPSPRAPARGRARDGRPGELGQSLGEPVGRLVERILSRRPHLERGGRARSGCSGATAPPWGDPGPDLPDGRARPWRGRGTARSRPDPAAGVPADGAGGHDSRAGPTRPSGVPFLAALIRRCPRPQPISCPWWWAAWRDRGSPWLLPRLDGAGSDRARPQGRGLL